MNIPPYEPNEKYDKGFKMLAEASTKFLKHRKDDNLILCVGGTNTGKSMLSLHMMQLYMGDQASIKYIGLDQSQFANALKAVKDKPTLPKFLCHDEANISKRDAMTRYNKSVIDLYFSIRGLRIFHWWNTPSLDMIDKPFVDEVLKGVILITDKSVHRPRVYYYFRQSGILKILKKYDNLKIDTIKRVRKKYAWYRGWFKDYNGYLRPAYEKKKQARMDCKVDDFYKEYGKVDDIFSKKDVKATLKISSDMTLWNYEKKLKKEGLLQEGDITTTPTGRKFYSKNCLEEFKELAKKNIKKGMGNIK